MGFSSGGTANVDGQDISPSSVDSGDVNIDPDDNQPATAGLDHPLQLTPDDNSNRGVALWQYEDDPGAGDSDPGRRTGITSLYPDGQELWRVTGDTSEDEFSLYGNTDTRGGGSSSFATTKLLNIETMDVNNGVDVSWQKINFYFVEVNSIEMEGFNSGPAFSLKRAGASADAQLRWEDENANNLHRIFVDASLSDRFRMQDAANTRDFFEYQPDQDRVYIRDANGTLRYLDGNGDWVT